MIGHIIGSFKILERIGEGGMVTNLDAKTGKVIWGPERTIRGSVSSSPILADGRIYFTNEEVVTIVVSAGPEFEIISTNELDGTYTLSSPLACTAGRG